ncbi:MAG: CerR family C-terminal domain-containing protein [Syntrophobacteraceae bacterium]|nr:CerR family C-terminal domain-containing protein [Syntrophobacteraceae bacterium]
MGDSARKNDDTKARLIEAAGEVFAQHGFRSATVRDICSRAGVHVGAVNYHFGSKEGLYAAVLTHTHQSAVKKYPPQLGLRQGATPEEKLRAFILSFLLRTMDEGFPAWHGKLLARELADPTDALDQLLQNSVRPLFAYLAGILGELLGEAKPAEGEENDVIFLSMMSIIGQCLQHFTARRAIAVLRPKSFDPSDIGRIADHITRFSLGGIRELGARETG